jgi:hypothetical protein
MLLNGSFTTLLLYYWLDYSSHSLLNLLLLNSLCVRLVAAHPMLQAFFFKKKRPLCVLLVAAHPMLLETKKKDV